MLVIISFRLLLKCLPLLEQYLLFAQFYLNEQVAAFRVTCKMLYLQLNVFLDLAANGFCVPKDLDLEEGETDESGEKTEKGGMGLAEGEGTKDVSDKIESEDQLEDARPADQEQEKQDDKTCKEEEKGIDMSEDFDSKPQDMEKDDDDEEQSDHDEENDLDKEMGETGEGAEQLDKEIWGNDEEESEEGNQQPENEDEEEGTGERIGEKEMGAKDDKDKRKQHDDDDTNDDENREEENKKEINELNEPEIDEDQINPYHGKLQPQPEPQQLDLPEDINLDEGENKEDNGEEENPFDIDEMKDLKSPEQMNVELEKETEENKENDPEEESSEDEDKNGESMDSDGQKIQEELETNQETKEKDKENAETENKNEEQSRDEEVEEEKLQEKAAPSADDASEQMDAAQQVEETTEGSRDTVTQQPDQAKDQQETSAENTQEDSNDNGTGESESAQQESGHSGSSKQETIPASQRNAMTKSIEKRKNPGKSNEDRSLLEKFEPALKKLKTIYTQDEVSKKEKEDDSGNADGDKAEMAKHVKDSESFDDYTLDAATEDQVKQQASNTDKEEENQEEKKDDAMDVEMHEDEENNMADNKIEEQRPEKVSETPNDKRKKDSDGKRNNIESNQETTVELEGETAQTMRVQRGNETTFHTMEWNMEENNLDSSYTERKRFEVEKMLAEWAQIPSTEEAAVAWNCLCSVTDAAARDLSEKLRLVLEPTQASRLRGDYKTGKRINMRKIIPYIASQFRKDKIWLRRTKPFKRDYQIVLALDDSSSMADSHSKELAFESLSLISKAMTYLEVGQLSVVSFGEQVKILHPLGEAFTEQSGSRYLYPYLI